MRAAFALLFSAALEGFTDKNYYEENETKVVIIPASGRNIEEAPQRNSDLNQNQAMHVIERKQEKLQEDTDSKKERAKWIMRYLEEEEEKGEEETMKETDQQRRKREDPNGYYIDLREEMNQWKQEAALAKRSKDKSRQKQAGEKIKEIKSEMDELEKQGVVVVDHSEREKKQEIQQSLGSQEKQVTLEQEGDFDSLFGLEGDTVDIFTETSPPVPSNNKVEAIPLRDFKIGRGWTGKSPKILLQEYCRKNFQQCPQPKFERLAGSGSGITLQVKIHKPRNQEEIFVMAESCATMEEAQNYASTLALYRLNPNKPLYGLLPLPFKELWLEWLEQEAAAAQSLRFMVVHAIVIETGMSMKNKRPISLMTCSYNTALKKFQTFSKLKPPKKMWLNKNLSIQRVQSQNKKYTTVRKNTS